MSRKRSKRLGRLLFFIPIVGVLLLVVLAVISATANPTGVLVITAMSSDRYSQSVAIHASATVNNVTGTTPFNLSLPQGEHTIVFAPLSWYSTPPPRTVPVLAGKVQYAVEIYTPLLQVIGITPHGFNSTSISASHGITPVVWINNGSSTVVLQIDQVGNFPIQPSRNVTFVFPSPGTFVFGISNTPFSGTVVSQ